MNNFDSFFNLCWCVDYVVLIVCFVIVRVAFDVNRYFSRFANVSNCFIVWIDDSVSFVCVWNYFFDDGNIVIGIFFLGICNYFFYDGLCYFDVIVRVCDDVFFDVSYDFYMIVSLFFKGFDCLFSVIYD